jgi:hypothetical protein
MTFSKQEISRIESTYLVSLPRKYKRLLIAVGDKMLDTKLSNFLPDLSIYKLQEFALEVIQAAREDGDEIPNELTNAFFVMLRASEIMKEFYFIHPSACEDCPVYCWHVDVDYDSYYATKVGDTIDGWLSRIDFPLFIEAKLKIMADLNNWRG